MTLEETQQAARQPLRDYIRILSEGRWIILGCLVITLAVAALYTESRTPEYSSTSRVLVQDTDPGIASLGGGGSNEDPDVRAATNLDLASLPALAQRVVDDLNLSESADSVLGQVTATIKPNSRVLTLTALDPEPRRAAALANSFASAFVKFRLDTTRQRLTLTLSRLNTQLRDAITKAKSSGDNTEVTQLRGQISTLEAQNAVLTGDSEVIQDATVSTAPASPNKRRNYMLAVFFGLLVGVGLAGLRDRFDRRIKDLEQLKALFEGTPILSIVPPFGRNERQRAQAAEAYRTLQANLAFLDADRPLRSILVSGPGDGEGKSTTSLQLALAMAERGQRVLLVDGNLRDATLSETVHLSGLPGVSNYLAGQNGSIRDYVHHVELDSPSMNGHGKELALSGDVWVVPSGPKPPNPGQLLNAVALDEMLAQAQTLSDRVIVAGSPIGPYSDMLSLVRRSDGLLVVVRLNHTRRDEVQDLLTLLRQAQIRPLGLVVFADNR